MASTPGYRPGKSKYSRLRDASKFSKNRIAWCRVYVGQWSVLQHFPQDEDPDAAETTEVQVLESGPTYRLNWTTPQGRTIGFNLTAMTEAELDVFEAIMKVAIDLARDSIVIRDREANDAYERGDDSFTRSYRQVPQFFIREGAVGQDGQSLLQRFAGVVDRLRGRTDLGRTVRGDGGEVADAESTHRGPQDDGTQTNEPEGVHQVGEVVSDAGGLRSSDSPEGNSPPPA